jgi:hypothetical protein
LIEAARFSVDAPYYWFPPRPGPRPPVPPGTGNAKATTTSKAGGFVGIGGAGHITMYGPKLAAGTVRARWCRFSCTDPPFVT